MDCRKFADFYLQFPYILGSILKTTTCLENYFLTGYDVAQQNANFRISKQNNSKISIKIL